MTRRAAVLLALVALGVGFLLALGWGAFCDQNGIGDTAAGLGGIGLGLGVIFCWSVIRIRMPIR